MITIDFTYQTVTEESAQHGDFDSHGFIIPGMWKFDADDYDKRQQWNPGDLSSFIDFAQSLGIIFDGDNFYSVDPDIDYATGEHTTYGMHIAGASPFTIGRIGQLLAS